ncbi:hypothetical protein [Neisseria leonii]|uniref:hypothetical protein n=1 Tax=Neisseria leonii TaxID=2995413 RepID=UPI00237A9384|nr:hypothetical protein [Neisseria sp. 3986]MDD9324813.1 hypothetical protein [Neisseria sp. 3986]
MKRRHKDGVGSIGYAKQGSNIDVGSTRVISAGSMAGSIGGDAVVVAGGRLNTAASAISAGNDVLLQGKK